MKTKSGRSHFICEYRTYDLSGNLKYENTRFCFTAVNAENYIERRKKIFANMNQKAEFTNVVNLDEK